jgi:signal transduction histidine kinase
VVFQQEDIIIADALQESKYQDAASVNALKLRSVVAVPLIAREKILGALYVENRSEIDVFVSEDLRILKFFAAQAAVAIENAILNDELEERVNQRTAELQAAIERLQEGWHTAVEHNRIRTSFLGTIVHDIRSPLATAMNAQHLLLEGIFGELNEEQAQWVDTSLQTLNHIVNLTDDIFDLTKIEMGKLTLYPEDVNLPKFLKQVYDIGHIYQWKEGVTFRHDFADGLPDTLSIDPTRLQQVMLNLISNANKFTEAGEVVFYARQDGDYLCFGVRDTGAGIREDDLPTIFERYKQSGTKTMRQQGTGLGLAITKEIVHLHDGEITVQSRFGVGSDFCVTLPIRSHEPI